MSITRYDVAPRHRHGCREPIARATVLVELLVTFTHISHKPTALLIRRRQCRCQRCETHGSTHRSIPIPCCVSDESRQFGGTPRCRLSRNTCRLARSGEPVKGSPQGSPEGTRSALDGIGSGVQPRNAGTHESPTPQSGTWGRERGSDQPSVEGSDDASSAAAGAELDAGLRVDRRRVRAFLSGSANPILRSSSADHPALSAAE